MELTKKKCIPCEGGTPPLTPEQYKPFLEQVPTWRVQKITVDGQSVDTLQKNFSFKNFQKLMDFLVEVGKLAEVEGHHPNFYVHDYRFVDFTLYTHAIKGLHDNDFILAAKIDETYRQPSK